MNSKSAKTTNQIFSMLKNIPILLFLVPVISLQHLPAQSTEPLPSDGKNDATVAIQSRLSSLAAAGGTLVLPAGQYLITGTLRIPKGVALQGSWSAPHHGDVWQKGTTFLITGGKGQENARAAIEMEASTSLQGVTLIWPEQRWNDIQPYPWAIHGLGQHVTVENVTLMNAYQGIWVGSPGHLHLIRNIFGCVLRKGLFVDDCGDIGRIENVHFNPHYWLASGHPSSNLGVLPAMPPLPGKKPEQPANIQNVRKFMSENLEGFIFGRTDWEYVFNSFVLGAKYGYHFIKTAKGGCSGQFQGIGADNCRSCVQIDYITKYGIQVSNGDFTAFSGAPNSAVVTSPGTIGAAQFVNCNFWATPNHAVWMQGDTTVILSSCHLMNAPISGEILAEHGKLIIQGCAFDKPGTAVILKKDVRAAIIMGNLQEGGLQVQNEIGGKAQIGLNETP
jgi:hypothetical protein